MYIVDDEQRRNRPQSPCALRVPAVREQEKWGQSPIERPGLFFSSLIPAIGDCPHFSPSTMYIDVACVAPSCICPRQERRRRDGARNAAPANARTGA
jgi:hypothetical protein